MTTHPSPVPSHKTTRAGKGRLALLFVALPLLLGALLLAACGDATTPEPETTSPLARYLVALKPDSADELELVQTAPRYSLEVNVDVISRTLTGVGEIAVFNNSREPWNQILFRLYPNLEHYGGDLSVQSVSLDGRPTNYTYQDEGTTLRVLLPRPLLPKDQVNVRMAWTTWWPSWVDESAVYSLFGRSQKMVSLPLFYPALAVYQEGPALGSGKWWTEMGTVRGDAAYNEIALFAVTATLPKDEVPVTSGTTVITTSVSPTQTQYVWMTGPAREFVIHMSPAFSQASEEAYGTTVTSYWLPGDEAAGRAALRYGVASLRAYSDLYGAYPFRDMRIAPAPLGFRGMEYPQVMLLGPQLYGRMRNNLEFLVAHEMAHQWWYQVVHNDPITSPWMDEGLSEYSVKLYWEELRGRSNAELIQYQRWETPLQTLVNRGTDTTVAQPVESFKNGNQYETIVYGKGALFFDALRAELGNRRFLRFLQTYLAGHRWQTVNEDDFLAALHVLGDPTLLRLYREWVGERTVLSAQAPATGN